MNMHYDCAWGLSVRKKHASILSNTWCLALIGNASAADLPTKKAASIEYVRVCTAYGAGFFYIPGSDTCLRISGRARFDYLYQTSNTRTGTGGDVSGYVGLMRLNFDARTQTDYGALRAFLRLDVASRTGPFLTSASRQREGQAFPALGADAYGRAQMFNNVDKAFIQFGGLTAGRASSFFDFYAHDLEIIGGSHTSDNYSTNLLAYTAQFADGFSMTGAMEDPTFRRSPIYGTGSAVGAFTTSGGFAGFNNAFNPFTPSTFLAPIIVGPGAVAFQDVTQKNRVPDFVGVLRMDRPWGSAQFSAAVHEINGGDASSVVSGVSTATASLGISPQGRAASAYGFAVQGGVKINLPFISPGDVLYLQAAYAQGALSYTGVANYTAPYDALAATPSVGGSFQQYYADAVLNPTTGKYELSTSFSVVGSLLHYWSPAFRSAFFGSYAQIDYNSNGRNALAALGFGFLPTGTSAANTNAFLNSAVLRGTNQIVSGASLIWNPVKDLDIGLEGEYVRTALNNGVTPDLAKNSLRNVSYQDVAQFRFRVQRDF
ncbi:porin [Methylobacterium sp. V23]|uniref:porin n=1 Tax=Methylobacterium sp. V23 TaxID=2044878 RepID=UPI001FDEA57D|nr:porin [Methylobacterium sp. V23]